jgi:hypothetical protein
MPRLKEGASLCLFERAVVALAPGTAPRVLPLSLRSALDAALLDGAATTGSANHELAAALGELWIGGAAADTDPEHARALRELDLRYVGWLPGFAAHAKATAEVEAMHSRRFVWTTPRLTPPTLPASTLRRAQVIESLAPKQIFIADDPDGLSVLLARNAAVTVFEPHPIRLKWLQREAERAGCAKNLYVATEKSQSQSFDISVVYAGSPATCRDQLGLALDLTRVGGSIVVGIRLPWEELFMGLASAAGLEVTSYQREIDHWLVPGPTVIDGGQDLAILTRPNTAKLPEIDVTPAGVVRAVPYSHLDFDSLDATRLDLEALTRFADLLAAAAPTAEHSRSLQHAKDHDVLCWYDERGVGLSAELRRSEAHLLVSFMPFDPALEYAALFAATHTLADPYTRVRPLRTRRLDKENFFG